MQKSKQKTGQQAQLKQRTTIPLIAPAHEVEFVLECAGAEHVYVCGDFNEWKPAGLPMIGSPESGLWEKRLLLPPGRHEYKFVVDGQWRHDPDAHENVPNAFGSLNSVAEVEP